MSELTLGARHMIWPFIALMMSQIAQPISTDVTPMQTNQHWQCPSADQSVPYSPQPKAHVCLHQNADSSWIFCVYSHHISENWFLCEGVCWPEVIWSSKDWGTLPECEHLFNQLLDIFLAGDTHILGAIQTPSTHPGCYQEHLPPTGGH